MSKSKRRRSSDKPANPIPTSCFSPCSQVLGKYSGKLDDPQAALVKFLAPRGPSVTYHQRLNKYGEDVATFQGFMILVSCR